MRRLIAAVAVLGSLLVVVSVPPARGDATGLDGADDNVATSISWSGLLSGAQTVAVLARQDSYYDALAAGALAGSVGGPFLVTPSGSLDGRVAAELDRVGIETVRIIGGTAAVSPAVESALQAEGFETERLAGANRIDTAVAVAETFDSPTTVVLARGFGTGTAAFADSLGGGALATSLGAPLLLTETATLSDATASYIDRAGITDVVVVGGTAAVGDGVVTELEGMGVDVERLAGANRFATAAIVLDRSLPPGDQRIALIDGVHPDSWVSGFAASPGFGILLTNGADIPDETAAALDDVGTRSLVCAPQVTSSACGVADDVLNGEDLVLAGGRLVIPASDIGDEDLTALPVGDEHISRTSAAPGTLFLCSTFPTDGGGSMAEGPWMHGDTWDLTEKLWVLGQVTWTASEASVSVAGDDRVLSGNMLPNHTTGSFPIAGSDPASEYDQNPSAIAAVEYSIELPANPTPNTTEQCVGGEVGFLLSGIQLNSPVDAMGRDALAHELQDHCQGHPNNAGYHYHSVSRCIPDDGAGHSKLVGYALDGFGIYGTRGEHGVVLGNDDLDECHGHTHVIDWDGGQVSMYHYHATWQFPYAVGCFRGTSSFAGPVIPPTGGGPPGMP